MNTQKRSLKKDEKAVSPVIGVIMMIAIVVIIAAVVAAFAYGIIGGVKKAPSSALVGEGVRVDTDVNVSIFHHGGDTITGAFDNATKTEVGDKWANIEVRLNGQKITSTLPASQGCKGLTKNGVFYNVADWDSANFKPGDQLIVWFTELKEDDTIIILHGPSDNILQRITVSG